MIVRRCLFFQGRGQDEGSFGVLHVEGTEESQDFCIAYTTKWSRKNLPVELDLTVNRFDTFVTSLVFLKF